MAQTIRTATSTRPATILVNDDGTFSVSGMNVNNKTLGSLIKVEVQNPGNGAAIFTVPASTTFTGTVIVRQEAGSSASTAVSAATGGVQAKIGPTTVAAYDVVDVSIVGGASNAVTAVTTGSPVGSVILFGYYK